VYSQPGKGSTFKTYFPRVHERLQASTAPRKLAALGRSERILLVEDAEALRHLTREILEKNGYSVLDAHSGSSAFHLAKRYKRQIHLLLTDIVMPGMNGRELADLLNTKRPDLKVLYMSGYTSDAIIHHGVLQPGTFFIEKPFAADVLLRKVRQVLDTSPTERKASVRKTQHR
jgi:two-component system, cell cycle sensor histidine kinase and response regulator CckA